MTSFKYYIIIRYNIAIASFNAYHDAVKYVLEQLLGEQMVKNILE
ncbi:hypothetical protein A1E_01515 [Rickettsia canadensis str. McKiel]|uniref:Uncharacterized protein n=1 Tax=Rickettsia canadensis (strain McKiel) TaxID=293613 RepID=A8EY15_RICCK|nr:hypothetical protein [Rickettsia canadensis]ABV73248.1 hypothetical protein A1E_01515 [Rickettsia canadensis str. McKiel]